MPAPSCPRSRSHREHPPGRLGAARARRGSARRAVLHPKCAFCGVVGEEGQQDVRGGQKASSGVPGCWASSQAGLVHKSPSAAQWDPHILRESGRGDVGQRRGWIHPQITPKVLVPPNWV